MMYPPTDVSLWLKEQALVSITQVRVQAVITTNQSLGSPLIKEHARASVDVRSRVGDRHQGRRKAGRRVEKG